MRERERESRQRPILEMRVINVKRQNDTGLFFCQKQKRRNDVRGEKIIL